MIGLTGAHRTGKSTLAQVISDQYQIPLLSSSASRVASEVGFDLARPHTFNERMNFQDKVLDAYLTDAKKLPVKFVTDRTPIDMAAYALSDLPEHSHDDYVRFLAYLGRCFEATQRLFTAVFWIRPGIPYVAEPGKPPSSLAYQFKIDALIGGLLQHPSCMGNFIRIPAECLDLASRFQVVHGSMCVAVQHSQRQMISAGIVYQ